ncbi:MAG TPA: hypothetical protein VE776_11695 [Actinomycetota bacterium]|jgi:ABC-type multidrug transport system ATPase subunit|nr:hypothetical protein [Actinomycetota bacterium]
MNAVISVGGPTRWFGTWCDVVDVAFEVGAGEVSGFLGSHGRVVDRLSIIEEGRIVVTGTEGACGSEGSMAE